MFLVEDRRARSTYLVFTGEDPRKDGYTGHVIEGVRLDYDMEQVHSWPDGHARPEASVGRAPDDSKHYKVFKYIRDRQAAGYQQVTGTPVVFGSWADYLNIHLNPPHPEQTADEDWFDYLDELDDASRRRRHLAPAPAAPAGSNRDEVAAWVGKEHLITDSGVREVWYLPQGSPPNEIRLLELNDRFAGNEAHVEALDFGLEVGGVPFRLFVADITSDQLARIKNDPSRLPRGWSLDGSRIWRRRGA